LEVDDINESDFDEEVCDDDADEDEDVSTYEIQSYQER
jgi:hypothetical protein